MTTELIAQARNALVTAKTESRMLPMDEAGPWLRERIQEAIDLLADALEAQQAGGEPVAPVVNNQFTRAWLQLDQLPGRMMQCNGEPFGPVPASTSCWITTDEEERARMEAEGHKMLSVYTHPAPAQGGQKL